MDFIDYISKQAPDGETCLLVKQKPVGSEQHADGTIKATWPAFYPNEYKEGGAWYCNTASFIIERFKTSMSNPPKDKLLEDTVPVPPLVIVIVSLILILLPPITVVM